MPVPASQPSMYYCQTETDKLLAPLPCASGYLQHQLAWGRTGHGPAPWPWPCGRGQGVGGGSGPCPICQPVGLAVRLGSSSSSAWVRTDRHR